MWLSWFFSPSFWSESLVAGRASHADYDALEVVLIVLVFLFGWYVWRHSHEDAPLTILAGLVVLTGALLVVFASTYFNFGSAQNFVIHHGGRLTHIDALSLAVGNLSTAGSTVTPRSQWARGIVMTQQLVDFAFLGFIAAIAISRLRAPGLGIRGRGAGWDDHAPNPARES
jgi:hypothetical protein